MKVVTKVTFSKRFQKQFNKVPLFIQNKVLEWVLEVRVEGWRLASRPNGLHDEPLAGSRWGQRSIRLNKAYRLIYRIIEEQVHIEVLEIHKHDY